ncbi:MAG: hypothetical protein ACK4PI_07565 [Tepidisphaerales bacterium]
MSLEITHNPSAAGCRSGCRYAVLLHTGIPEGSHYDLLVEPKPGEGDLMTWRLPAWPLTAADEVRRLRDHRRVYLTYEGPIRGDRGVVHRVDEGLAEVDVSARVVTLSLGARGRLRLELLNDDRWWCAPESAG